MKMPNAVKVIKKTLKRAVKSENLKKLIIITSSLALIATGVLPFIL